jgi:Domain of unknown function (DUF4352)
MLRVGVGIFATLGFVFVCLFVWGWWLSTHPDRTVATASLTVATRVATAVPTPTIPLLKWALTFRRAEPMAYTVVSSDTGGPSRVQQPTGVFVRVYFALQNRSPRSDSVPSSDISLTDGQGRTYKSDFQVRQVQPSGDSQPFGNVGIAPNSSVELNVTFDVARDARDLVLHVQGGNDIQVGAVPVQEAAQPAVVPTPTADVARLVTGVEEYLSRDWR